MIDLIGFLLIVPSTLIITLLTGLILYARWHRGELEALGIPVVKPHWLLGSNWNYMQMNHHREDLRRSQTLGPVFGVYNGRTPEVFVSDLEMLHRIFFKDSDHFYDKFPHNFGHPTINDITEFLNGEKWKVSRSSMTPAFTSAKMKMLTQPLPKLCEEYISVLKSDCTKAGGRIKTEIYRFLPPFALEVLAECLCGLKLKDARSPTNEFVSMMRLALWEDLKFDWTYNWLQVFPFLTKFSARFPVDPMEYFDSIMRDILDKRERSPDIQTPDPVQAFLEMRKKIGSPEYQRLNITEHTIHGQFFQIFVAAFFGVNSTISYLFYFLATYPGVQKRLQEEIDSVILEESKGTNVDLDTSAKLPYLTACITETFRIATSFHRLERVCTKDWEFKGYKFKKGMHIFIPMSAVHHNPEVYEKPEIFNPERFLPENSKNLHPCSYLAFGMGHRACVGNKFMMETFKSLMVRVIRDFQIERRTDTVWKENPGNHFLFDLDPIYVDLVLRKKNN